jgi:hypothetical protein
MTLPWPRRGRVFFWSFEMDKIELVGRTTDDNNDDCDIRIVMCIPCVEGFNVGFIPYKNSSVKECSQCKIKVWVGPKQMELVKKEGLEIWCPVCCVKKYGEEEVKAAMKILTNKRMGE